MNRGVIVVDGFYRNPEEIREFALRSCEWLSVEALDPRFAGTETRQCYFSRSVVERLSACVGYEIQPNPRHTSFGAFALTSIADQRKRVVHVDGSSWTGIVYLTPDRYAKGGTSFYRHRETGLDRLPTPAQLSEMGFSDIEGFRQNVLEADSADDAAWELNIFVEMRFNRLVLFRAGELFHAADEYFGHTTEDSRLVQLFFF